MWQVAPIGTETEGTSHQGGVDAKFGTLRKLFGAPQYDAAVTPDGAYKITAEWTFVDAAGRVVTLHDWKDSSFYNKSLPGLTTLRRREQGWTIGAKDYDTAREFRDWLYDYAERNLKKRR